MAKRSAAHTKAQRQGKIRDNSTCQVCGSTHKVEGHHIIDHQFRGAASIDNIVALCHNCHRDVHAGRMDIAKF